MNHLTLSILLTFSLLQTESRASIQKHYDFDTSDTAINASDCLKDLKIHGRDSVWRCLDGRLQMLSPNAGLKFLSSKLYNGSVSFEIVDRISTFPAARGETVVWLRNSEGPVGMERVRIVIEEGRSFDTRVRIEELVGGSPYIVLAKGTTPYYVGEYKIALRNGRVQVIANGTAIVAQTRVNQGGGIYLIGSSGEGATSDYDNLRVNIQN